MPDISELFQSTTEAEVSAAAGKLTEAIKKKQTRLEIIDELRGVCILMMVLYHAFFLRWAAFGSEKAGQAYAFFAHWQPAVSAVFIIISGFCTQLSIDMRKRALTLLVMALGFSLVTTVLLPSLGMSGTAVWFGILHFLAFSKLIYFLFQKFFGKIPTLVGIPLCLILFYFFSKIGHGILDFLGYRQFQLPSFFYHSNLLLPLGFHKQDFVSWDYFPLLPYFFLFLFGAFMGRFSKHLPDFFYKKHLLLFGWLGRNSLTIYLLHLPILYGIFYLTALLYPM